MKRNFVFQNLCQNFPDFLAIFTAYKDIFKGALHSLKRNVTCRTNSIALHQSAVYKNYLTDALKEIGQHKRIKRTRRPRNVLCKYSLRL